MPYNGNKRLRRKYRTRRRPRFGKLGRRKYYKKHRGHRRTAKRRALGLTGYGINRRLSLKPILVKAIGADSQPIINFFNNQSGLKFDGKFVLHWYQSVNALYGLPSIKQKFKNYGEFRLRGVGIKIWDTNGPHWGQLDSEDTVPSGSKVMEWAWRPIRQYDQFADTFDFDKQVGHRQNIPDNFTKLKSFPDTTYRLTFADKPIRLYIKSPMWNAESVTGSTQGKTWGNAEYPLYPENPYMWHSTDFIEAQLSKSHPISFIMGQFSMRHPDSIAVDKNWLFNCTYYLEFRKKKTSENEDWPTGIYPGRYGP